MFFSYFLEVFFREIAGNVTVCDHCTKLIQNHAAFKKTFFAFKRSVYSFTLLLFKLSGNSSYSERNSGVVCWTVDMLSGRTFKAETFLSIKLLFIFLNVHRLCANSQTVGRSSRTG